MKVDSKANQSNYHIYQVKKNDHRIHLNRELTLDKIPHSFLLKILQISSRRQHLWPDERHLQKTMQLTTYLIVRN